MKKWNIVSYDITSLLLNDITPYRQLQAYDNAIIY